MRPHLGGVFETMIKASKQAVSNILGNADITDEEELHTVFTGVESLLNACPLTYHSADIKDIMPLTPNRFLFGQVGGEITLESVKAEDKTLLEMMDTRMATLIISSCNIVLVISPDTPWGKCLLGRALRVFPGPDSQIKKS